MIKLILYGLLFYLGFKIFKYVSSFQIKSSYKSGAINDEGEEPYSKLDIQDAEFKDIEE